MDLKSGESLHYLKNYVFLSIFVWENSKTETMTIFGHKNMVREVVGKLTLNGFGVKFDPRVLLQVPSTGDWFTIGLIVLAG